VTSSPGKAETAKISQDRTPKNPSKAVCASSNDRHAHARSAAGNVSREAQAAAAEIV
jgi:hypothetical protein